ncbi:MAG: diguanylate cyclase [Solirubrobacterales bacterium]
MDYKSLFSALSLFSVFIYLYVGLYTFKQNSKSIIHRFFLLLCLSYGIWSFAYAFAYVSVDKYVFSIWNKTAAFGWCSFSAISLYLVLLITENKIVKNKAAAIIIFLPGVLFLYMALFLFGEGIQTSTLVSEFFYTGDFIYNFSYLLISILIVFRWGLKSKSKRVKIQAKILVITSLVPFCLNLLTQTILPLIGLGEFPLMGQIYSLIMILGIYFIITKYKFLKMPESFLLQEIGTKIMDMVILTNEKQEIVRVSKHTEKMLGFNKQEIIGKNIGFLFEKSINLHTAMELEGKYNDIGMVGKNGLKIPTNINYMPIIDNKFNEFLGAVLVVHDISAEYELRRINAELKEKTIRDSLTNLYNHQYSMEIIKNEINCISESNRDLSLMMLDIDHFKRVNDTYGHVFGDYVLETISSILLDNINNEKEYVGRFGGEEFIIMLPRTPIEEAYDIGESIRNRIEKYEFNNDLKLTVSIGIKQYRNESPMQLVKNADDLLYKAKQNGRNRIEYGI